MKMFSDAERTEKDKRVFRNWVKTNKYTLKANWIDHTHARNIVNGRLWGQLTRTRADYDDYPIEYIQSTNCGAVDGFPVKVYINGVYQGIYTWNIRKDESMFNMDDSTGIHAALIADIGSAVTTWNELPEIDGTDWTDELNDTVPEVVKTSFRARYMFVMESTDEEFKKNIGSHFYLSSLIDYYIFITSIVMVGGAFKSQTMLTYDAIKYLANIYDMDATWTLNWDGQGFSDAKAPIKNIYTELNGYTNRLYERLVQNFADEIKARYAEVRQNVLSDANIINEFERFIDVIPLELYAEDYAATTAGGAFTGIPSTDTNNLQKLRDVITTRMAFCDLHIPLIGIKNEGGALYPLTNATKNVDGHTLTVTNGKHVRMERTLVSDNASGARVDCSFPDNTQSNSAESASLNTTWFAVPAGVSLTFTISNLEITGGAKNGILVIRKVGGGAVGDSVLTFLTNGIQSTVTSYTTTITDNVSASYLMLFCDFTDVGAIEFDVSITVNGLQYV